MSTVSIDMNSFTTVDAWLDGIQLAAKYAEVFRVMTFNAYICTLWCTLLITHFVN